MKNTIFCKITFLIKKLASKPVMLFINDDQLSFPLETVSVRAGTAQQCCDAVDHLARIIEKKHVSLNKAKNRRRPRYVMLLPFPFFPPTIK